jgi:nucleoside-diphosphate-sugar epimerase
MATTMPTHEPRTAFVTGSTGFLGLNLVAHLTDLGWKVYALHRARSNRAYLQRFPVQMVEGVIEDRACLEQAMPAGIDVVFHTAADVSFWSGHRQRQARTNVDGTRNLVALALKRRVKRFIHTSTTSVYGFQSGPFDESAPHLGRGSWFNYMHTKAQAEEEVRQAITQGLSAVLLNPANIVGPYDLHNWSRLIRLAVQGRLPRIPPGRGSFCHVTEVARAHIAAVDLGQVGANYILGGTDASFADVVQTIGEIVSRKVHARLAPPRVMRALGRILGWVSVLTRREPFVTPESAAFLCADLTCISDRAVRELNYRVVPLRTMLEDCYRWMVAEGLLS